MAPRKATAAATAASTKNATAKAAKPAPKKAAAVAKTARARKVADPELIEEELEAAADGEQAEEDKASEVEEKASSKTQPNKKLPTKKTTAASKPKKSETKAVNGTATKKTKKQAEEQAEEHEEKQEESSAQGTRKNNKRKEPELEQEQNQQEKSQKKRKQRDEDEHKPAVKKVRTVPVPTVGKAINEAPKDTLDVFVFGEGTSGELGLGSKKYDGKKPIDVKRPRINHNLSNKDVGVVQLSCGGMHVIALTHDDRILTWGVNDDRALGRDTTWDGGVRDMDNEDSDSEDDDDTGMNPHESTPGEVDFTDIKIEGTKFVQVAATDSASFVLTEDGRVYGWGTFRGADGIIGFSNGVRVQQVPIMIEGLKNITRLSAGANHVLALDIDGKVFSWGSSGQYQLGRKAVTRGGNSGLKPEPCGRFTRKHHAVDIATGSYHSFYTDNQGRIWAWGLNNYSQTGHNDDRGKDDAMIIHPKVVESLVGKNIVSLDGGEHHSVAATDDGQLLTWGRVDGHQVGQPKEIYNEDNTVYDDNGRPRILSEPTPAKDVKATFVAAGTDTSFALTKNGQVYSWGFSANYQTGQGTSEDVEVPTLIDNTALRGRKVIWAGAGGQYSIVAASPEVVPNGTTNGH